MNLMEHADNMMLRLGAWMKAVTAGAIPTDYSALRNRFTKPSRRREFLTSKRPI